MSEPIIISDDDSEESCTLCAEAGYALCECAPLATPTAPPYDWNGPLRWRDMLVVPRWNNETLRFEVALEPLPVVPEEELSPVVRLWIRRKRQRESAQTMPPKRRKKK